MTEALAWIFAVSVTLLLIMYGGSPVTVAELIASWRAQADAWFAKPRGREHAQPLQSYIDGWANGLRSAADDLERLDTAGRVAAAEGGAACDA